MLYRCDCAPFNIKNNHYRKFCTALIFLYSQSFLSSRLIKTIGIILFEPGGLLDEAIIIQKILEYTTNIKYKINIVIYIIETNAENNKNIYNAYHFFYKKFTAYENIKINFFSDISLFKKHFNYLHYDYLLFLSLDPYEYIHLYYFKNEQEDIINIIKKVPFFLYLSLFNLNGFFYDIELSFSLYNNQISENFFLKYTLLGKKNAIVYCTKYYYYFN